MNLNQIILEWIGEDATFPERESDEYDAGYAKAISDLRDRVPELVEKIIAQSTQTLKNTKVTTGSVQSGVAGIIQNAFITALQNQLREGKI